MDVSLVIRHRLNELGLQQRDLATATQVTESYVSQLLTGKKAPPMTHRTDVYEKMEAFLKLPSGALSKLADLQRIEELKRRLEYRATESAEALQDRLNKAAYEISFRHHFNKIIINDNLQHACEEARHVISDFLHRGGFLH